MAGLRPIIGENACAMILGSYPSVISREKGEYYGNPQNSFWRILFALFNQPYVDDYERKKKLILQNRLVLWDVLQNQDSENSADEDIKNPVPNDFRVLFSKEPGIRAIFFTGAKAYELFIKNIPKNILPRDVKLHKLLSTSPRNARYSFEQKLENYRIIQETVQYACE